jgi:DNA-binding MarR family transcriptional regulator
MNVKMGQGEVVKILEEKGSLTEKQIAEYLGITINSAFTCLRRLIKYGEVERTLKDFNEQGKKIGIGCYIFTLKQVTKNDKKRI